MTKQYIPFFKGIGVGLLVVLLSFNFASALLFLQDQTDISESYTAEQTTVITLLNDQPRSQNIHIQIAPSSQYLLSYIDIEDTTITLIPGEKKNVLLNTEFPSDTLSPETHIIELIARSDDDKSIAKTQVTFDVPGIAAPSLKILLEEFDLDKEEKTISLELENDGNVIMRPKAEIVISQGKEIVKSIEYKTPIQIMPTRTYPITLRLDTASLEEGTYETYVKFSARDNIHVETETQFFDVKAEYEDETKEINIIIPLGIGGLLIILILALLYVNKQLQKKGDPLMKKMKIIEEKEQKMEKELQKLINETHQLINTTNKWIRKNIGKEHELR